MSAADSNVSESEREAAKPYADMVRKCGSPGEFDKLADTIVKYGITLREGLSRKVGMRFILGAMSADEKLGYTWVQIDAVVAKLAKPEKAELSTAVSKSNVPVDEDAAAAGAVSCEPSSAGL